MHSCPECDVACYCDGEDHDNGLPAQQECVHVCEDQPDDYEEWI